MKAVESMLCAYCLLPSYGVIEFENVVMMLVAALFETRTKLPRKGNTLTSVTI